MKSVSKPCLQNESRIFQALSTENSNLRSHDDSVSIPQSFYSSICKACDLLENLPMNKLMYCFGDELSVITKLLHERLVIFKLIILFVEAQTQIL